VLLRWQAPQPCRSPPRSAVAGAVGPYADPYARDSRTPRRPEGLFPLLMPLGGQSAAVSAADWPPSGEWCGQAERMRFARLMQRPGRLLGGPAVRAAFGGNLKPALAATQGGTTVHRSCPAPATTPPPSPGCAAPILTSSACQPAPGRERMPVRSRPPALAPRVFGPLPSVTGRRTRPRAMDPTHHRPSSPHAAARRSGTEIRNVWGDAPAAQRRVPMRYRVAAEQLQQVPSRVHRPDWVFRAARTAPVGSTHAVCATTGAVSAGSMRSVLRC
jgi:hypothetical protein